MRTLLANISELATFKGDTAIHGQAMGNITLQKNCAILLEGTNIAQIYDVAHPAVTADKIIDCANSLVTAGYVDCHTHAVYAGERSREFAMRLAGSSYMEIMKAGGGIINTVNATRAATQAKLTSLTAARLNKALCYGVTTMEIKSGYGLDINTEVMQLNAAEKASELTGVEVALTYMGAHATPQGSTTEQYVDFICNEALNYVKNNTNARFCDCFCEPNVFNVAQITRILTAAKKLGFELKAHTDEVERIGGTVAAVKLGARSCEHLLNANDEDVAALASSNTVAVLLPLTAFSLRAPYAPARKMIDKGCAVSIATDLNPGSCNCQSIPLLIALSTMYMGLNIAETLCALTLNAACAIGKEKALGTVEKGKQADLIIHNVADVNELFYNFAQPSVKTVIKKGVVVYQA